MCIKFNLVLLFFCFCSLLSCTFTRDMDVRSIYVKKTYQSEFESTLNYEVSILVNMTTPIFDPDYINFVELNIYDYENEKEYTYTFHFEENELLFSDGKAIRIKDKRSEEDNGVSITADFRQYEPSRCSECFSGRFEIFDPIFGVHSLLVKYKEQKIPSSSDD